MKILIVAFAVLSITNGQELKGDLDVKNNGTSSGGGAQGSGEISVGGSHGQSQSGGGNGGSSWGDILKGISDGIGQVVGDLEKPTKDIGNSLCLALSQGFNQVINWEDYVGHTFTIAIDGQPVANGTVTAGNGTQTRRHHRGDQRHLYRGAKGVKVGEGSYRKKHGAHHANGEVH